MRKIGLALGAGAARGLAHIGVIEVLQEKGIKVDCIAGCSIGSIVGACLAVNGNISFLKEKVTGMTRKDLLHLVDLGPGKYGIIKGEKIRKWIDRLLDGKGFRDTIIPFRAVAADLATGKEVVFKSGKLSDAIRASISIPGVFVPVEFKGRTLADGGLVNSTPVDTVRKMGADVVIGVDLPYARLKNKPTIIEAVMQGYEIMRERLLEPGRDTVMIYPRFPDRFTDYRFLKKEYIDIGRKAAQAKIADIKKTCAISL